MTDKVRQVDLHQPIIVISMLTLGFVLETLTDYQVTGSEPPLASVVIDSRRARTGSLFIAIERETVDGHDYVTEAIDRGAIAALIERPVTIDCEIVDTRETSKNQVQTELNLSLPICLMVESTPDALQTLGKKWREKFTELRVLGITGSVGKTSSRDLTHSVLSRRFNTLKSEDDYSNDISVPLALLSLRPWHQRAVLEIGLHKTGDIQNLCEIAQPQVGVITIVGSVHMDLLGSTEAIAAVKQELVEALPSAPAGVAILNMDDPRVMAMADHTQAHVLTYGLDQRADFWADNIVSMGLEGIHFVLHYGDELLHLQVPLLGRHSVHTALRASAAGLVEGMSWDEIIAGLRGTSAQLRLVAVPGPKGSIILDDTYNSSPESAIAAINLLADLYGRRVAVLGDMLELGPAEEVSHRILGRRAREVADLLVTVGPRARLIAEEAMAVGMSKDHVHMVSDSESTAPLLEKIVEPGDFILIKGSREVRMDRIVAALGRD